jgi:TolB-like protein/DNA-binding winged helix-turn-helix (wHTH) protein/thioredoxin-like negative regulator of GroEL
MPATAKHVYQFGAFRLDEGDRLLYRNGELVALTPKAFDTLLLLVANSGHVLPKDEMMKRLWPDTFVEEATLAQYISLLRKALGESAWIENHPRRGYRFTAPVVDVQESPAELRIEEHARKGTVTEEEVIAEPRRVDGWARRRWVSGGLAALGLLGTVAYVLLPPRATKPKITSLAVLPLDNLSGDPTQEYFADGMTEALIGNLARIRALRVVSRTSVMRFKGARTAVPEIARALKVDALIEGSVQRTADRVRISVQLIHAPTDTHLWAREYERDLTDILKLQSEVARAVAEEIRIQVTADERARMASAGTVNPAAHQEYLLGQYHLWKLTEEHLARAIDHFERATHLDPGYAPAHAGLSHAWWWRGIWGAKTFEEVDAPSRAAARKAAELDPRLAEAHVSMGRNKYADWDWPGAETDFGRALEIDPNNLDAHFFHGMLFMAWGRFPEAIAHMQKAEQLDPLSGTVQSGFGRVLYRARRFEEAISHLNRAIALEPESAGAHGRLADVYEQMGRYIEALAMHEKAGALLHGPPGRDVRVARIYARMGKRNEARQMLDRWPETNRHYEVLAGVYAALGDKDEAFRLLFKKARPSLNYVKTDPSLENLHSDPRWPVLLRHMNLPFP